MFEVADVYEDRMGRWSRQLAPVSDFGQNHAGLEDRRHRSF